MTKTIKKRTKHEAPAKRARAAPAKDRPTDAKVSRRNCGGDGGHVEGPGPGPGDHPAVDGKAAELSPSSGKPAYQILQEEWNRLVPFAQAADIPRVRPIRVGPGISYRSRKERLEALREQLRAAVGSAHFAAIMSGEAKPPMPETTRILRRAEQQAGPSGQLGSDVEVVLRGSDAAAPGSDGLPPSPQEYRGRRAALDRNARLPAGHIEPAILPAIDEHERAEIAALGLVVTDYSGHFLVTDPLVRRYFAFRDASKRGQYRGGNLRSLLLAAREVRATIPPQEGKPERSTEGD